VSRILEPGREAQEVGFFPFLNTALLVVEERNATNPQQVRIIEQTSLGSGVFLELPYATSSLGSNQSARGNNLRREDCYGLEWKNPAG
jgi:hypothetical protein